MSLNSNRNNDHIVGTGDVNLAKERVRQSSALIEVSYEPLFIWDLEAGITEWNAGAEMLYGFSKAEALGKTSHRLLRTNHPVPLEEYLEVLRSDGYWSGEVHHVAKDGRKLLIESRQQLIDSMGRHLVVESNLNITGRRAEQNRLTLLAEIGEIIRTSTIAEALLFAVSKAIGEYIDVNRCLFNEIDLENDREIVHRDYSKNGGSVAGSHKLSSYSAITSADMASGRTVVNFDSKTDPRTAKLFAKTYRPAGERSYVAVPLMREGKWIASLWVSCIEPRSWSNSEVTLLETIAERAWNAVDRLRNEKALRESQERFSKAFNASPLAITITALDTGKLVDINDTFAALTGYDRAEAVGHTTLELGLWEDQSAREKELATFTEKGKISNLESRFRLKDGKTIHVLLSAEKIELGGQVCALSVIQDITERKYSEGISQRYRLLSEQSTDVIWFLKPNGDFVDVNLGAVESYGYSRDEFLNMNIQDVRPASTYSDLAEQLTKANAGIAHFETIHVRKDGSTFPVEVKANAADFGGERLILAIIRDSTDRKTAEAALRESEERRHLAQEAGNVGIWDWNIRSGRTYWSETMWNFYGEPRSDINPDEKYWSEHLHENDRERVKLNIRKLVESGGDRFTDEFQIVRKDGTTRWIEAIATVLRDPSGEAVRMLGVNLDITDRKNAEERIRLSEYQLRLLTNELPALISYVDRDERYQFVNRRFAEWFDKPVDALIGKTVRTVVGVGAYRILKPHIDEALSGKDSSFETLLQYRKIGSHYVHVSYVPDLGVDGSIHGFYGLTHDLSDLKRSQDLLRSSEERIGLLMESLTDYAIFSVDQEGKIDSWNRGARSIFGYTQDEILGRPYEFLFEHDDIKRKIPAKEMSIARKKGRAFDERWHIRKDGTRFFASGVMMPLQVGKKLTGYAKILSDLTQKKRHAEELQQARDELELRVKERTRELARSNVALINEMEEREAAERQKAELLRRLVTSQELERRRFARDLHDQLGQRLTALRLKIASLKEISAGDDLIHSRVQRLQEISEKLDSEVSFLAWELRPSALDDLGLVDAIGAFVNEWSRHHEIPADFHSAGLSGKRLGNDTETHLYRIIQEALNNIAKHADAKCVNVLLERRENNVILIAEDDGIGFDPSREKTLGKPGGLGLIGMQERAVLIGGGIEIESAPDNGTTIYVRVPMVNNK